MTLKRFQLLSAIRHFANIQKKIRYIETLIWNKWIRTAILSIYHMSHNITKPTKWLYAQWRLRSARRNLGSLATHWAHSEESERTGRMSRLICVFAGRTLILMIFSCRGSHIANFAINSQGNCTSLHVGTLINFTICSKISLSVSIGTIYLAKVHHQFQVIFYLLIHVDEAIWNTIWSY